LIDSGFDIAGVLAAGIDAPVTMARMNEFIGLYGVSSEICEIVNNKAKFREWMLKNNFETPKYREFFQEEWHAARDYLRVAEYPLIIKNVNSSASRGTKLFSDYDENAQKAIFLEACQVSRTNSALIESAWEGTEHTVETFFDINGEFKPLFITDRFFDKSEGFPIEIGLKNPTSLTEEEANSCFSLAYRVAQELGIKVGAAKFDMIYTAVGPRIIEMTTRLSGGFDCQYLVPAATGLNVVGAAVMTALGEPIPENFLHHSKARVALSTSIWPDEGRITSIEGFETAKSIMGVEHIFMRASVGDYVGGYRNCADRVCFVIVSGETLEEAQLSLSEVKRILVIRVEKND